MPKNDKSVSSQRGTNPPTRDPNAVQRVALAVKLRATRMPYETIAQQCGYSNASACRKAIMRELDRTVVKNIDTLRTEEAESLDRLEAECWKILYDKDRQKGQLFAVDRILQVKERRAKLFGLDTPPRSSETAHNMVVVREIPAGYLGTDTKETQE